MSKFIESKIKIGKKTATIEVPLSMVKSLYPQKVNGNAKMFLIVTNGILQCSRNVPDLYIPPCDIDLEAFVAQPTNANVE